MKTEKFDVTGMTCASCVAHVEKSVSKLPGIKMVQVNLLTNSMTVSYDENQLNDTTIEDSVEDAGYTAHLKNDTATSSDKNARKIDHVQEEQREMNRRWWSSLTFLIPLLYLSMGHMFNFPLPTIFKGNENALIFAFSQFLLTLPIVIFNKKYFITGFKTLFKAAPNMDSLIAMGSSAALIYGIFAIFRIGYGMGHNQPEVVSRFAHDLYFESAGTILTLITLGKYLEARSKSRTSDAISRLIDLAPKTAIIIKNGIESEIPVENVQIGDEIVVRNGQSVPVDGVILSGNGNLDESALTGESMTVFKQAGQTVMTASINKTGYFTFKATKVGKDTTLAQIISLVEDAASSKAPVSKLADKISSIFVPVVIGIATLATIIWLLLGYPFDFALSIGIAVLVISCPCALGLATPVAIMVGTGKGAEHGILIKSAESLELAQKIDTIVLDKTGTITLGKPSVTDIVITSGLFENELLKIAYALENPSEHALADAIINEAQKKNIALMEVQNFTTFPGKGLSAKFENELYFAGNEQLMRENNIPTDEFLPKANDFANQGKTPLFISKEDKLLGLIAVADIIKPGSAEAIAAFKKAGLSVVMLTGDHHRTAAYVQSQLGIHSVISEVLPQDKEQEIVRLQSQGKKVAMVGDGINDAPALMRADVGIAIGAGTDIAIDAADIVLMRNNLMDVASAIQLSKKVMRNIKENLFWAFFYNVLGIPLAAGAFYAIFGWKLNPMFAAAAMSFSSVTVVLNALRLLKFKPENSQSANNQPQGINIQANSQTINNSIMTIKTLKISGMSCGHCSARVEKVLNSIDGVEAKVDLETNSAKITLSKDVSNDLIKSTVDNIGYEIVDIIE
ncbi:MAG: heavy metal translocating P-type ATPase [Paludibacter sp.]|nr:heavy metal translocating P-type ATPase [Paludibacter sp.]